MVARYRRYRAEQERLRKLALQRRREELRLSEAEQRAADQQRRADERAAAEQERERRRIYEERQRAEAAKRTAALQERIEELDGLLRSTLTVRTHIDFGQLKRVVDVGPFDPGHLARSHPSPRWEDFAPTRPTGLTRLFVTRKYARAVEAAEQQFAEANARHAVAETVREENLAAARERHEQRVTELRQQLRRENAAIDAFQREFLERDPEAVAKYFELVLDARADLLQMSPVKFEHLVRQLFESRGMTAWVTQASRDDGVDAVATNSDPIVGGLCVIQAKRYKNVVPTESVRALAGVMEDKRATRGIMVTTSWYGAESQAYAQRHGRMAPS